MVFTTQTLQFMRPKWGRNKRFANGRKPFNPLLIEPFPAERTPMRCRNRIVDSKGDREDVACIREMYALFECMKGHDLDETKCPGELANFQKCFSSHMQQWKAKQLIKDPTEPIPGQTKLTSHQINVMLARYPQKIDI